jgi:HSP20 family protein
MIKPIAGAGAYIEPSAAQSDRASSATPFIRGITMSNLRLLDPVFGNEFDTVLRRLFAPAVLESETAPALKMRIDVTENDKGFNVKADIPGVKKEDISVKIDGHVVSINAEAKSEKETRSNGDKVLRSERYYGSISRTFSLGQDVDDTKVEARYVDGVLTLDLPKKAPAAASKIVVQ